MEESEEDTSICSIIKSSITTEKSEYSMMDTDNIKYYDNMYSTEFCNGFLEQNANKIIHGKFLGVDVEIQTTPPTAPLFSKNHDKEIPETIGQIKYWCQTKKEYRITDLFPTYARYNTNAEYRIPSKCNMYIEVNALIQSPTNSINIEEKLANKKQFYEKLFTMSTQNMVNVCHETKIVLFVFYGMDFTEVCYKFSSNIYKSIIIFLPLVNCIRWQSEEKYNKLMVKYKKNEEKLKMSKKITK